MIHGDFERGFIRAETIAYDDYVTLGGEAGAREAGKMRAEGKTYRVQGRRRPALPVQRLTRRGRRPPPLLQGFVHRGVVRLAGPMAPSTRRVHRPRQQPVTERPGNRARDAS